MPKKIDRFLTILKLMTLVKSIQRYIGFGDFYRQNIPNLVKNLLLYQLLQKQTNFQLTHVHEDAGFDINENLVKAAKLWLRLPLSDQQLVILCESNEHAAGYVLLIDDYANKITAASKIIAPVAFGSRRFTTGQMFLAMNAKDLLAVHFALDEFGHVLWGVKKPIVVMTDSKDSTRVFQAKEIPPKI